jgi:hypothetical protein
MKTTEQKLDDLIDTEIEYLTSLCLHNDYDELYQIILNQFGYKELTENEIKEQYQARFDEEEENPDIEPDYNAKTAQERAGEQQEIYRTLK